MRPTESTTSRTAGAAWCLALLLGLAACASPEPEWGRALPAGVEALRPLPADWPRPDVSFAWYERAEVLPALEHSLSWARKPSAPQHFPAAGVGHERVVASLERFGELLRTSRSRAEFRDAVNREFDVYMSAGWDGRGGGVLFTGYCTPILEGSLTRGGRFQHPLYGLPPDLVKDEHGAIKGRRVGNAILAYPTRRQIEERDLLAGKGLELCWLADPVDAFIAHVNGSAVVRLPDGELLRLGYAGKNGREYSSLGKALVAAGELPEDGVSLPAIRAWARRTPAARVDKHLWTNDSYVFFTPIEATPHGSLNVPVTAERTLATDKTLFPRGSLVFVDTVVPDGAGGSQPFRQLMLDQDTGGAIRTAGRADIYLGTGDLAERRAGATASPGQLYYLFLKDGRRPR